MGAYNVTTHAIAGFREKVLGKGTGKGRIREKGRVMERRGGRRRERMERRGRQGKGLAPWVPEDSIVCSRLAQVGSIAR